MPDSVVIGNAFADVEDDPERVHHPADRQQRHAAHRQLYRQLIDHDKRQPTHGQIGDQRQDFKAVRDGQLKQDPQQRQAPDDDHQPLRQRRVQPYQQKRRIGPGD